MEIHLKLHLHLLKIVASVRCQQEGKVCNHKIKDQFHQDQGITTLHSLLIGDLDLTPIWRGSKIYRRLQDLHQMTTYPILSKNYKIREDRFDLR